ncbi:hypothetical protein LC608_29000 [Nostoc sp. XA010]|nr:hypothetical protein [Nostoc sp. XA010]MCC5660938.1 hypothetical protein [Nostoc sp. XA010]
MILNSPRGVRCILAIANDASIIKPTACERPKGGYGSKMMNAMPAAGYA